MNLAHALNSFGSRLYKRCNLTRVLISCLILVPLYNEFLVYTLQSWLWSSVQLHSSGQQLKILLVADPQLQGYKDESSVLGFLTRWDADRYLRKTFAIANSFAQPDVVLYLGDLLDEGSIAQDEEYVDYVSRFSDVFKVNKETLQVYIPGDNDVGGEGFDPREEWKVNRFRKFFSATSSQVVSVKFVDFIKMEYNYIHSYTDEMRQKMLAVADKCQNQLRVILNHMPLMDRVREGFQKGRLYTCIDCHETQRSVKWTGGIKDMKDYSVYTFELNHDVTLSEITVPTCSYRMGVPRMGYGYAVIGMNGDMQFTVLWLPSRYRQLYSYIFLLCFIPTVILLRCMLLRWFSYKKLSSSASR